MWSAHRTVSSNPRTTPQGAVFNPSRFNSRRRGTAVFQVSFSFLPCFCNSLSSFSSLLYGDQATSESLETSMAHEPLRPRRVCVIGAGAAGLACAWSLSEHPDRFEVSSPSLPLRASFASPANPARVVTLYVNALSGCRKKSQAGGDSDGDDEVRV